MPCHADEEMRAYYGGREGIKALLGSVGRVWRWKEAASLYSRASILACLFQCWELAGNVKGSNIPFSPGTFKNLRAERTYILLPNLYLRQPESPGPQVVWKRSSQSCVVPSDRDRKWLSLWWTAQAKDQVGEAARTQRTDNTTKGQDNGQGRRNGSALGSDL